MDEMCQKDMMAAGAPYPRTCKQCGLGPCKKGYNPKWTPDNPVGKGPEMLADRYDPVAENEQGNVPFDQQVDEDAARRKEAAFDPSEALKLAVRDFRDLKGGEHFRFVGGQRVFVYDGGGKYHTRDPLHETAMAYTLQPHENPPVLLVREPVQRDAVRAHSYLTRLLREVAPGIEPFDDLLGLCTQVDNLLAGYRRYPEQEKKEAERRGLEAEIRDLTEQRDALLSEMEKQRFVDETAQRMLPLAIQLSIQQRPTLAGQAPQATIDYGQAGILAIQCALALWMARDAQVRGLIPGMERMPDPRKQN